MHRYMRHIYKLDNSFVALEMANLGCAFVFAAPDRPMNVEQVELPEPASLGPGELLVRITAATLCGSDIHTIEGKRSDPAAPLVLGHEGVGVVEAT